MFVNNTKNYSSRAIRDKNTSFVCGHDLCFRPKNLAAVLFLAVYRDTVPLTDFFFLNAYESKCSILGENGSFIRNVHISSGPFMWSALCPINTVI